MEPRAGAGGQDGFGYSWLCELYRELTGRLKPMLRQVHTAGERVFVDDEAGMRSIALIGASFC